MQWQYMEEMPTLEHSEKLKSNSLSNQNKSSCVTYYFKF